MDHQNFPTLFSGLCKAARPYFCLYQKMPTAKAHKTYYYIPSLLTLKNPCKPQNPLTDTNLV
ncbi:Hypothetical protein FKW44_012680 [Caligus rogercresseyi]|uniref:Uncharacterized protein n=1 Tax=Caligus rogercresseyi TaxID=217165 RepID=A0A7T8K9Q3_CALRO|nr:Hypothetical protein FKW44_012680 [Caligus rogercresseyi]